MIHYGLGRHADVLPTENVVKIAKVQFTPMQDHNGQLLTCHFPAAHRLRVRLLHHSRNHQDLYLVDVRPYLPITRIPRCLIRHRWNRRRLGDLHHLRERVSVQPDR